MKFCQPHWDKLRELIFATDLKPFVASSGEELHGRLSKEVKGEVTVPDPLMTAHNLVLSRAMENLGLYLMYINRIEKMVIIVLCAKRMKNCHHIRRVKRSAVIYG